MRVQFPSANACGCLSQILDISSALQIELNLWSWYWKEFRAFLCNKLQRKSCFATFILEQYLVCDNLKISHFWKLKKKKKSLKLPVLLLSGRMSL